MNTAREYPQIIQVWIVGSSDEEALCCFGKAKSHGLTKLCTSGHSVTKSKGCVRIRHCCIDGMGRFLGLQKTCRSNLEAWDRNAKNKGAPTCERASRPVTKLSDHLTLQYRTVSVPYPPETNYCNRIAYHNNLRNTRSLFVPDYGYILPSNSSVRYRSLVQVADDVGRRYFAVDSRAGGSKQGCCGAKCEWVFRGLSPDKLVHLSAVGTTGDPAPIAPEEVGPALSGVFATVDRSQPGTKKKAARGIRTV
ncbi:hypothetical protein QBC37DRAFT_450641 [Rhypophila decipiens]|uniref:Uncharacterized protein n=1 Tax=Rhypophila decipiens TaxID=261697 RepID=A0AAN6Y0Y0_9PEZI|nr:hypothetical protein QBC37DRAFT_450641 [Rhypophila decipiens]